MGDVVIKPSRSDEWYVVWSSIVEAPLAWGSRAYIADYLLHREGWRSVWEAMGRVDRTGTSAVWPSPDKPYNGWGVQHRGEIYQQQGWLPAERIRELCDRLALDEDADVHDLLEPFNDPDVPEWGPCDTPRCVCEGKGAKRRD